MSDERVEAAIKNWAPRFTSQGVDYNDFFRTTSRVEKWEDWCREWVATADIHYDLAVKAEAKGNSVSAGEAYIGAALCYHFGKFVFQDPLNVGLLSQYEGISRLQEDEVRIPTEPVPLSDLLRNHDLALARHLHDVHRL